MDKVWVLTIEHRHGVSVSAHRSESGAEAALFGYVEEEWKVEMDDRPMPESQGEAVDLYFDAVPDEHRAIHELRVED